MSSLKNVSYKSKKTSENSLKTFLTRKPNINPEYSVMLMPCFFYQHFKCNFCNTSNGIFHTAMLHHLTESGF